MGKRLASRDTVRVELAEGFWIDIKAELNYGERRSIRAPILQATSEGKVIVPHEKVEELGLRMVEACLLNWNVEDDEGNHLPVTRENIDRLKEEDLDLIYGAINKQYGGMTDEVKKTLPSIS